MPSLASACRDCTACAATWGGEWRGMFNPSGLSMATRPPLAPPGESRSRSRSSPLTRTATTVRSLPYRSRPVVPVPVTVSWATPSEVMVIDMEDTPVRLDGGVLMLDPLFHPPRQPWLRRHRTLGWG